MLRKLGRGAEFPCSGDIARRVKHLKRQRRPDNDSRVAGDAACEYGNTARDHSDTARDHSDPACEYSDPACEYSDPTEHPSDVDVGLHFAQFYSKYNNSKHDDSKHDDSKHHNTDPWQHSFDDKSQQHAWRVTQEWTLRTSSRHDQRNFDHRIDF